MPKSIKYYNKCQLKSSFMSNTRAVVSQEHIVVSIKHMIYTGIRAGRGGIEVTMGRHFVLAGAVWPYTQSSSSISTSESHRSQSSTNTPTQESSGCISTSTLGPRSCTWRSLSALIRSSASGAAFGGSSLIGSQPTGGDPGGEMRKFLSIAGGRKKLASGTDWPKLVIKGLGSALYTRKIVCDMSEVPRRIIGSHSVLASSACSSSV
jgi:hypothetical protein